MNVEAPQPVPVKQVIPAKQVVAAPPGEMTLDKNEICPIQSLNPYQNRWTIKARVTAKSDIKTWNNVRGTGTLFSVELTDAQGGEIKATMFNDAVDLFEPLFVVDKVYYISKGSLKPANKKFTNLKNEYELTLDKISLVQLAPDCPEIPKMTYDFTPIDQIGTMEKDSLVGTGVYIIIPCLLKL